MNILEKKDKDNINLEELQIKINKLQEKKKNFEENKKIIKSSNISNCDEDSLENKQKSLKTSNLIKKIK